MYFIYCSVFEGEKPETTRMLSLFLSEISFILQTFPTCYTLHLSLLNKTPFGFYTNISSLSTLSAPDP